MTANNNIRGRLALITGASGGVGAPYARQLILQDVDLTLSCLFNVLAIEELAAQLRKEHDCQRPEAGYVRISTHKVNLASVKETVQLCEDLRKAHGRSVDILISNAGYGIQSMSIFERHSCWSEGLVDRIKGKKQERIIFVSSIAAYGAGINGAHYPASKAGLIGMMKNLLSRLAEHGITVNDVAPAMVGSTAMLSSADSVPELVDSIPLGRLCASEEVANVVYMYCATGFATRQSMIVAGELNHKWPLIVVE